MVHFTNAQIQTTLAKAASALKPYEIFALTDALIRVKHVEDEDVNLGAAESTLAVIFPAVGNNP
ncbi:MAG: hypothetical protein NVS1B11_36310 [Terriglobales bacterium]